MSSFEDITDGEPPAIDPYEVLGLERSATADQVKSAYRKAALKHHPDKVSEDQKEDAHKKFQEIAFANAILSDPVRRKRYDTTGSTSESIFDADGFSWSDYYREQFADAVSSATIAKFAEKYKGSDEEKDDLLKSYDTYKGNMNRVFQSVMLSNARDDAERFRVIIDAAIASGDVPSYPKYTRETKKSKEKRLKQADREAEEAEEYAKELGIHEKIFGGKEGGTSGTGNGTGGKKKRKAAGEGDNDALAAMIQKRQADRGASFLDHLAEKYGANDGSTSKKKGKKRAAPAEVDEPPEEAFQATAATMAKNKAEKEQAAGERRSKRAKR